jgi:hypothetical protein
VNALPALTVSDSMKSHENSLRYHVIHELQLLAPN